MQMRAPPAILSLVCVGALTPCLSIADGGDAPAPPGYAWCALAHFSGGVMVPTGWFCREIRVPNGSGYQMTREEGVSQSAGHADGSAGNTKPFDFNRLSKNAD